MENTIWGIDLWLLTQALIIGVVGGGGGGLLGKWFWKRRQKA